MTELLKDKSSLVGYVKGPNGPIPLTVEVLSVLENFVVARSFSVANINLADKDGKTMATAVRFPISLDELRWSTLSIYSNIYASRSISFIDYYYLILLVERFYLLESSFRPVLANLIKHNLLLSSFITNDDLLYSIYRFCFERGTTANVCRNINSKANISINYRTDLKELLKNYSSIDINGDDDSYITIQVTGLLSIIKYAPSIKTFLDKKALDPTVLITQKINNKKPIKLLFTFSNKIGEYEIYQIKGTELINADDRKNYIRFIKLEGC